MVVTSDAPMKEGFLMKRGEYNTALKARWCKVEGSKLLYFKKRGNTKEVGFIPLEHSVIRRSREDLGEEFCFEIVTKARVYYLVGKSETEMAEWIHVLSLRTTLYRENQLLERSEAMISGEAYQHALEDEQRYLAAYKKRRKTSSTWAPRRIGSGSDFNSSPTPSFVLKSAASEMNVGRK